MKTNKNNNKNTPKNSGFNAEPIGEVVTHGPKFDIYGKPTTKSKKVKK